MEIDSSTIITGNFNISLASMDKSSREKFNKETAEADGFDRSVQNIQCSRIYILLKGTWNFLKDRPYLEPQNKSQ